MGDRTTRPFRKLPRKYTFIILAVLSGIIGAIWIAIDTYTSEAIVVDITTMESNEYAFAIQSMLIGLIVSILFVLILWIPISKEPFENLIARFRKDDQTQDPQQAVPQNAKPKKKRRRFSFLGQYIDPRFQGIQLPTKKMLLWLVLSGLVSGVNTLIYFILIKNMELSVFLPVSQFVVVYLLIGDLIVDKAKPAAIEIQSMLMIVVGVILAALNFSSGSEGINVKDIVLAFIVLNGSSAVYVIFQKKAIQVKDQKGRAMDSTNIRLWTLVFMATFTVLFTVPFMRQADWIVFKDTFVNAILPVALSMLLVFVARILYMRALAMGKMSIVNSLASVSVIAGIPITMICSLIWPEYFQMPSGDLAWVVWLMRGLGALLVFTGIVGLSISEVKIMILAKVKGGEICDLEKIKSISGVERVSAITGKYDLMIILRSRTIGRGYQPIVDQLSKIPCLDEIVSSSILKEWNA